MEFSAENIKMRYGLPASPSTGELTCFVDRYRQLVDQGVPQEQAGVEAAKQSFPGFGSVGYAGVTTQSISQMIEEIRTALARRRGQA